MGDATTAITTKSTRPNATIYEQTFYARFPYMGSWVPFQIIWARCLLSQISE